MEPEEIKLHELSSRQLISKPVLTKEWVIDPPYIYKLDDKVAINVVRIRMNSLAKLSKLEAQIKEVEADMFSEISKTLG